MPRRLVEMDRMGSDPDMQRRTSSHDTMGSDTPGHLHPGSGMPSRRSSGSFSGSSQPYGQVPPPQATAVAVSSPVSQHTAHSSHSSQGNRWAADPAIVSQFRHSGQLPPEAMIYQPNEPSVPQQRFGGYTPPPHPFPSKAPATMSGPPPRGPGKGLTQKFYSHAYPQPQPGGRNPNPSQPRSHQDPRERFTVLRDVPALQGSSLSRRVSGSPTSGGGGGAEWIRAGSDVDFNHGQHHQQYPAPGLPHSHSYPGSAHSGDTRGRAQPPPPPPPPPNLRRGGRGEDGSGAPDRVNPQYPYADPVAGAHGQGTGSQGMYPFTGSGGGVGQYGGMNAPMMGMGQSMGMGTGSAATPQYPYSAPVPPPLSFPLLRPGITAPPPFVPMENIYMQGFVAGAESYEPTSATMPNAQNQQTTFDAQGHGATGTGNGFGSAAGPELESPTELTKLVFPESDTRTVEVDGVSVPLHSLLHNNALRLLLANNFLKGKLCKASGYHDPCTCRYIHRAELQVGGSTIHLRHLQEGPGVKLLLYTTALDGTWCTNPQPHNVDVCTFIHLSPTATIKHPLQELQEEEANRQAASDRPSQLRSSAKPWTGPRHGSSSVRGNNEEEAKNQEGEMEERRLVVDGRTVLASSYYPNPALNYLLRNPDKTGRECCLSIPHDIGTCTYLHSAYFPVEDWGFAHYSYIMVNGGLRYLLEHNKATGRLCPYTTPHETAQCTYIHLKSGAKPHHPFDGIQNSFGSIGWNRSFAAYGLESQRHSPEDEGGDGLTEGNADGDVFHTSQSGGDAYANNDSQLFMHGGNNRPPWNSTSGGQGQGEYYPLDQYFNGISNNNNYGNGNNYAAYKQGQGADSVVGEDPLGQGGYFQCPNCSTDLLPESLQLQGICQCCGVDWNARFYEEEPVGGVYDETVPPPHHYSTHFDGTMDYSDPNGPLSFKPALKLAYSPRLPTGHRQTFLQSVV